MDKRERLIFFIASFSILIFLLLFLMKQDAMFIPFYKLYPFALFDYAIKIIQNGFYQFLLKSVFLDNEKLIVILAAPLTEEAIFRGPLLFLKKKSFPVVFWFVVLALDFAFVYGHYYGLGRSLFLFGWGIFLSLAVIKWRGWGFAAAVLSHIVINTTAFFIGA